MANEPDDAPIQGVAIPPRAPESRERDGVLISRPLTPPARRSSIVPSSPRSFGRLSQLASTLASTFATSPNNHDVDNNAGTETVVDTTASSSTWRNLRNPISSWTNNSSNNNNDDDMATNIRTRRHRHSVHDIASSSSTPLVDEPQTGAFISRVRHGLAESFTDRLSSHWPWSSPSKEQDGDDDDEDDDNDIQTRFGMFDYDHATDLDVDDEACFVDGWEGKVDFLCSLPHELSLYILLHLDFDQILTVGQVSRQWRSLAQDNVLWRDLFHQRPHWQIKLEKPDMVTNRVLSRSQASPSEYHGPNSSTSSRTLDATTELSPSTNRSTRTTDRRVNTVTDELNLLSLSPAMSRTASSQSQQRHQPRSPTASLNVDNELTQARQSSSSLRRPSAAVVQGTAAPSVSTSSTHVYAYTPASSTATTSSFTTPTRPTMSRTSSRSSIMSTQSSPTLVTTSLSSLPPSLGPCRKPSSATIPPLGPVPSPSLTTTPSTPLHLNWSKLFKERFLLDQRWKRGEPKSTWLKGHTDSVYCIQFDDKHVISGSRDQTIRLWDLTTSTCIKTLKGHEGSVLCLQSDSKILISGSSDSRILIWDLIGDQQTGKGKYQIIKSLIGHVAGVLDVCFNEKWIASCSKDTTIRVWHRDSGQLYRVLAGHRGPVNAVQLHGDKVVSASGDSFMKLWDITTGEVLRTFAGHERGLACVKWSTSGRYLVSGSNDRTIKVWSTETGECLKTLRGHGDLVRSLSFDEVNSRIVSAGYDRTVRVWDFNKGVEVHRFSGHSSLVFDVAFSITRIVSASHDQRILSLDFGAGLDTKLFV
ncbi:hypothetical protein OIO90_004189 [Microbotryomycetes sp. JL221]|nr:hypothetical protein OIO90_004189 [Microbotryomycetes sp. JL221]